MSEPSTNGTTLGYKAATMYVISEKGLETGPFLYGKPTDSRVFSEYRNSAECFSSGLNTSQMNSSTKMSFPVELGPRRTEKICVINLNDVLCKYQKRFPGSELKRNVDQWKDPSYIYHQTSQTAEAEDIELPDSHTVATNKQQDVLSIRGTDSVKREPNVDGETKFRLAKLPRSVQMSVDKAFKIETTFWNETKRHDCNTKARDEKRIFVGNPHEKADRRPGELILLKRIQYSSREKNRLSEREKSTGDVTGKREWERRRELQHGSRKQLRIVEMKAERPSKSLGKKTKGTSSLKLPVVATGMASKNPVTFDQKDYDRWSRRGKKVSPNIYFTESAKSGKYLLPSITKKC